MKSLLEIYKKRLQESIEQHQELNPKFWDGFELKDEVASKLLQIKDWFVEYIDVPVRVIDARFVGSNAAYNYTDQSDVDLHIVINFEELDASHELLQAMFNAQKTSFNEKYDITIKDHNVELYVEDVNATTMSNGIYSLMKNEWVKKPEYHEMPDINLEPELSMYMDRINEVINGNDIDAVMNLIDEIYILRKDSIMNGEWARGNLIFKEIRNQGGLDSLKIKRDELKSQELSLESNKITEE
jgi:hypothetical protein